MEKCGLWDQITGNAIVCSEIFQQYEVEAEQAGLQQVVNNARTNYGADSITAQVAQSVADAQAKNARSDVSSVNDFVENSSVGKVLDATCDGAPGIDLSFIGAGCVKYSTLKFAGLIAGGLAVVGLLLYALGIAKAFLPSRG